eukprot:COSAG05_NODE_1546_length_4588_cov_3.851637_6_plen_38_part_00
MRGFYITDDDLQTHPYVVTVVPTGASTINPTCENMHD